MRRGPRGAVSGWVNRRFAKRLFSMLMVISLLSNTLGFAVDDLGLVQNGPVSVENEDIFIESNGPDLDGLSDSLELDGLLSGDSDESLELNSDLSLDSNLASNGAEGGHTYTYRLADETRLLLSDLVEPLELPVSDMKTVENVVLLDNEADPAINMSLFVSVVAIEDDFLILLKPGFAEAKLTVYTRDSLFTLRLVGDPTLKVEDVARAAQKLAENPAPFDALFSCDFERQPVDIRLSALLEQVGLPVEVKNVTDVGIVEHYGDEGHCLSIENL